MTENKPQPYSQTTSPPPEELYYPAGREPTSLTPAEVDPEAAAELDREMNKRAAKERKEPFIVPEFPPGLTSNQKINLATSSGQRGVSYKPVPNAEEGEHPPQDEEE